MKRHQADRKVWIYVILVFSGYVDGENRKGRGAFFLHLLTFPPFGILVFFALLYCSPRLDRVRLFCATLFLVFLCFF